MRLGVQKQAPAEAFLFILTFLTKHYGFDVASFINARNISMKELQIKGTKINAVYINELIEEAIAYAGDSSVLFKLSESVNPNKLGVLGYLMLHSRNVEEAIIKLCRYYPLIGKTLKPFFVAENGMYKLTLLIHKEDEMEHLEKYSAEIHLSALLHLINKIIPQPIFPKQTIFRHTKPLHVKAYQSVFGETILFDEVENALYFDKAQLAMKTSYDNPYLLSVFEKEAEQSLGLSVHGSLSEHVKGFILIGTGELDVSLESVAHKVGMHPRTLQKKLKIEGTSFVALLGEVRQKLATHYLQKGLDTPTIASYLGYAEPSPFLRAFKKWYGLSPKAWLALHVKS
ncbi:HTH-type transcriptional regulator, AraC family [Sulfurospirillum diekertiae]|uniref:HTH-type transcriptional regulator, AraC family n=1 Tax=Sulfurospirillum diekertiae TaxID=1854492 RepID=A0A290HED3_9BACT|nr:AraC family transcriptional regulator [Sulfurospirillum diekertiae]ATB69775.1 HTH-type transcriptional regulator, AraC family [Sulfurospirillum diekertiae]